MADLRITGVSTSHLELEAGDGTKHTLEITEDLLKALKARKSSSSTPTLTPREIQEQIRFGKTIEQLLLTNSADEDMIRKFGAPIVAELNHVVALARNVRLNITSDRFADPANLEFGSVIDERLRANGASATSWSAYKSTEGHWLVKVSFNLSAQDKQAIWAFNQKQLVLTPENETAIQLSNAMPISTNTRSAEAAISDPVFEPASSFIHPVNEPGLYVEAPTGLTVVPEIEEVAETEVISIQEDTSSRPTLRVIEDQPETIFEAQYLDEPLDEPAQEEAVEVETIFENENLDEEPYQETVPEESAKPQVTSRWAEVLFGAKEDEEEEF